MTSIYAAADAQCRTEVRDGMRIDWDVPVRMEDGVVLRADVYRPVKDGKYPVLLSYGPYAKWLHFQDGYPYQWQKLEKHFPNILARSSNRYQNWELVDPEIWVPDGYVCVRVDSRGMGRSPGYLDPWSWREAEDFAICVDWAGVQAWSNGKVGLNGISYYGMNQWQVASLQPRHLAAICVWEGAADFYRDMGHHGGIACRFAETWFREAVVPRQHGKGANGYKSRINGEWISGPPTLSEEELASNRTDYGRDVLAHPLCDKYWKARMPDYSKINVPLLSAGNWGGVGLHPRGNTEGYVNAASTQKWLEMHGLDHFTHFYSDYGMALQKRFFGHFLKGENTGWDQQPRVQLQVRHPHETFVERAESEWPLARTRWTKAYLDPASRKLAAEVPEAPKTITYDALGDGLTFLLDPVEKETEITGPVAAKLFISSETADADVFLVLRAFAPDMREIVYQGSNDPHTPVGIGWLRASHRKLDAKLTLPYRPYHSHDEVQPLTPGKIYELDIEIWPTSIVLPEGYRLALSVRGRDYIYPGFEPGQANVAGRIYYGVGPFKHDLRGNRPVEVYGGKVTVHTGPDHPSHVLLPVIPAK
ncbi:MAG: CocE/NonD family hydrolase [Burkholderiales bacterium]|nr:CocE/NonD family hydrolase [Burkholderiales bacterium]